MVAGASLTGTTLTGPRSVTDLEAGVAVWEMADGRWFRIVNRHWEPDELEAELARLGWQAKMARTDWFICGHPTGGPRSGQGLSSGDTQAGRD